MDDWQKGDLALCITRRHRAFREPSPYVTVGRLYTVEVVGVPLASLDGEYGLGLIEAKPPMPGYGIPASMFIKVSPRAADRSDRHVIRLMSSRKVGA